MIPGVCSMMSFFIGVSQVCFMPSPVGDCTMCCPRDDDIDIQYKLFTRSNPTNYEVIHPSDSSTLSSTRFNASQPTVIYLFGFSEAITGPSTTHMKKAFLTRGDYNFIGVDWSRLIVFPWQVNITYIPDFVNDSDKTDDKVEGIHPIVKIYEIRFGLCPFQLLGKYIAAVKNTRYMGHKLAEFVEFLNSNGVPAASLHVVGFSLGAEAAGFAGKNLKARGLRIGRITGLDPAYPGYSLGGKDSHLSKGDAIFVDVLHSNPGLFGFPEPIGDVDFYPNAGQWIQPGCWIDQLVKNMELSYFYGCSHNRSWRLFAESVVNPRGFPATLCRDWTSGTAACRFTVDGYMGYGAQKRLRGKMYLFTREKPPYARNGP